MSICCHAITSLRFSARTSCVNERRSREEPGREITEKLPAGISAIWYIFCSSRTLYSSLRAIAIGSKGYTSIISQGTNTDYSAYSKSNVGNPGRRFLAALPRCALALFARVERSRRNCLNHQANYADYTIAFRQDSYPGDTPMKNWLGMCGPLPKTLLWKSKDL